jgi:hypothetical protein
VEFGEANPLAMELRVKLAMTAINRKQQKQLSF